MEGQAERNTKIFRFGAEVKPRGGSRREAVMEAKMTWRQLKEHWTALGYTAESFSMAARGALPKQRGLSEAALSRNLKERPDGLVPEVVANWALTQMEPAPGGKRPEAVEATKAAPAEPEPKEPKAATASVEPV